MGLTESARDGYLLDYHIIIIEYVRSISLRKNKKNNNYSDCRKNAAMRINRWGLSAAATEAEY